MLLSAAAALGIAACGSSRPSSGSYVGRASNAAIYVQWTRSGNKLTGELHQALLQGSSGQTGVSSQSVAFTGTVSGSSVTLTLNQGLGSTTNLTGSLRSSQLALSYPGRNGGVITVSMTSASAAAYNTDTAALRQRARRANTQYANQQAAQQQASEVDTDAQTVSQDLSTLANAESETVTNGPVNQGLTTMRHDVALTLHEEQHVLDEAGHAPSYTVCSDADDVSSDADDVDSDLDDLGSDQDDSSGNATDISTAVKQLKQDAAVLRADRQNAPQDIPGDAPTQQQISQAIAKAKDAVSGEDDTIGGGMSQGKALYKTAEGYANAAQKACNAAGG